MIRRPPFFTLLLAILATASVVFWPTPAEAARVKSIVLVMDTSGSMSPSEIEAAQAAAEKFMDTVPDTVRVGLIDFDGAARVVTKPTTDRDALRTGLATLKTGGGTALYSAVIIGLSLAGTDGSVVILSDGKDTAKTTSLAEAQAAIARSGVSVDAVAFSTTGIPPGLTELVSSGHGRVVTAKDAPELAGAFRDAALAASAAESRARLDALTVTVDKPFLPLWAAVVCIFALLVVAVLMLWPRKKIEIQDAPSIEQFTGSMFDEPENENSASSVLKLSQRYVARRGLEARIALALDRANLSMKPNEWVALRACGAVAATALMAVLTKNILISVIFGVLLTWVVSTMWLKHRQKKRMAAFADQLPDTLQVVASSLRSGFSLNQALSAAHERGLEPMSPELGRALAAARIGSGLEDELDAIGVRMASEDWKWAVMAIRIQRNVGGNLAEILLTTAHTLRERAAMGRQVKALSAEGRLSAYILIGMPIALGAYLFLVRRDYIKPLWTTTPGIMMLVVALSGIVVGWFWMKKVIEVKV